MQARHHQQQEGAEICNRLQRAHSNQLPLTSPHQARWASAHHDMNEVSHVAGMTLASACCYNLQITSWQWQPRRALEEQCTCLPELDLFLQNI